jgi:hypothetical protein
MQPFKGLKDLALVAVLASAGFVASIGALVGVAWIVKLLVKSGLLATR